MRDPRFGVWRGGERDTRALPSEIERARGLASAIAPSPPGSASIRRALQELGHVHEPAWSAFVERFSSLVREDRERLDAWTNELSREVNAAVSDPEVLLLSAKRDAEILRTYTHTWREEADPFAVWGRKYHRAYVSYRGEQPFFQLDLLLHIDPLAWSAAIDGLPTPGMMEMALLCFTNLREDPALIEHLLQVTPPVFDDEGHWVRSRSVVALLVAEKIVDHARALHGAVAERARRTYGVDEPEHVEAAQQLADLERDELPTWQRKALALLLQRSDGKYIALGLLEHLAHERLVEYNRHPEQHWSAEREAFRLLAETLQTVGVSVHGVRKAWLLAIARKEQKKNRSTGRLNVQKRSRKKDEHHGEGRRTLRGQGLPFLFGAAVMLEDQAAPQEPIEAFWCWFDELLVGRDPGLSLVRHGSAVAEVAERIGSLLSQVSDPGALLRATYLRLEPQRRRSLFTYRYEDFDEDLGSRLLILVGLYATFHWSDRIQASDERAKPQELFWWLYEAARRLWLTSMDHFRHRERQFIVPLCFAYMPFLFGDALGDALRRAIPPITNDAWMLSFAGWFLWKNGVEPARLVRLLREAGADLEAALRDAHQWATLPGVQPERRAEWRNPDFPVEMEDLSDALGLSLDEAPAENAPAQVKLTRRSLELSRSISWGSALLRHLEAEGCSPLRILPLDMGGSTWLLQAAVAPALQERYGLAPEMRVLAVYGQVRGHHLRAAQQDPTGALRVDPDLLVVVSDQPDLLHRLPLVAGPWGQRIPWVPSENGFALLSDALRDHLPSFDLFDYRDPVRGSALVGRRDRIDEIAARLLRGEAVGVFGLRKVGKSSLLRAVAEKIDPLGARRGMFESLTVPLPEEDPEALVVSLDVQGLAGRGLSVLLERLISALSERLSLVRIPRPARAPLDAPFPHAPAQPVLVNPASDAARLEALATSAVAPGLDPMDRLQALLEMVIERSTLPICFIIDEYDLLFEGYGGEPGMPGIERLFAMLRSLSHTTRRVSLALIGRDPDFSTRPLLGGFTNPLSGWVKDAWLGPLRREESDELLLRLGRRVGLEVGPETRDAAWQWTYGHPLLLRQYGAALFELAHAPPSRPRPVPTDPIHGDAAELFLVRAPVHTICAEVHALLEARFPEALELLVALSEAPVDEMARVVEQQGGPRSQAAFVLSRLGLLAFDSAGPWVPAVFRDHFAPAPSVVSNASRSAAGEE